MVPNFGHLVVKCLFGAKPIRFGYKIWCLCGSDGYPYDFAIYTVVNKKVDAIAEHSDPLNHELFFDSFFTSYNLLADLHLFYKQSKI